MTHDGEPDSYEYASRLATWIWEKHYKNESPHWKPLNDLLGVLTQIDNMTTGLAKAQPEQKPVALYVYKPTLPHGNLGNVADGDLPWVYDQDPSSGYSARMLVYTAPPQREWQGLTDEEVRDLWSWSMTAEAERTANTQQHAFARAIEAKLKEKNELP